MATLVVRTNASHGTDVKVGRIVVPASGGSETLTSSGTIQSLQTNGRFRAFVTDLAYDTGTTSTLILNDGTSDVPQADVLNFLDGNLLPTEGNYSVVARDSTGAETSQIAKNPCRVATTANIASLAGGAPDPVDTTVSLVIGDRVLVKDQSTGSQNGIYTVTTVGTGANGTWARATDFDEDIEVISGVSVTISEGTAFGGTVWLLDTANPITVDTTALSFTQYGAQGPQGADGDVTWEGTWVSQNYTTNQAVYYATTGASYVCKLNTISNEVPTNATYWDLLAKKGETGDTGPTGAGNFPTSLVTTIGADITLLGGAPDTLDGLGLATNDVILVKDQTAGAENGSYEVTTLGTGANGTWTRHPLADTSAEMAPGNWTTITDGATYPDSQWILTTNLPITLDTTVLTFEQINSVRHVEGPGAAVTDNAVVIWDGISSTLVQGGVATLDPATGDLALGSGSITTSGTVDGVDVSAHGARHVNGGADELDGDTLDITWNPTNYTPATVPAEANDVDDLTAHLYGIDQVLGTVGPPASSLQTATDTQTETSNTYVVIPNMTVTPAAGTYVVFLNCATSINTKSKNLNISIFLGGTEVTGTTRTVRSSANADPNAIATQARVTANGAQAIAGYWLVTGATGTVTNRSLILVEVS